MNGFLDRVVKAKESELAIKRARRPLDEIQRDLTAFPPRDFHAALTPGGTIIAEIKKRSPSVASFPRGKDPGRLAAVYRDNGAAAISIVTDEANFGTALTDVPSVRAAGELPVLVKDFIIDPYQVIEAWAAGADAILLIARLLTVDSLGALLNLVRQLGIFALVECHNEADIHAATNAGARIVGINNRDLRSLTTSLDTTRRLLPLIPANMLCVSESGIRSRAEIEELGARGAHAFLIGGSLLSAEDPGALLRTLNGEAP